MAKKRKRGRAHNYEGHTRQRPNGLYERQLSVRRGGTSKRVSAYGRTLEELEEDVRRKLQSLGARPRASASSRRRSVAEVAAEWLDGVLRKAETAERSMGTWSHYEGLIRLHVLPEIGDLRIASVTDPSSIEGVVDHARAKGLAPQSIHHLRSAMRRLFNYAKEQGYVAENPVLGTAKIKVQPYEGYALDEGTVKKLLAAAVGSPFEQAIRFHFTLACRLGELLGLRWGSVLWEQRKVRLHEQLRPVPKSLRERIFGPNGGDERLVLVQRLKWDSTRTPFMTPDLLRALQKRRARQNEDKLKARSKWRQQVPVLVSGRLDSLRQQKNTLVFTTDTGEPIDAKAYRRELQRLCKIVEIPWSSVEEYGFRPHDARHTGSTIAARRTKDPQAVMSMTGERSAQMFLHYTHVIEDAKEDVAKAMQAAFA